MQDFSRISGLLIDLEGVLYSDNKLIEGAIETIKTIIGSITIESP